MCRKCMKLKVNQHKCNCCRLIYEIYSDSYISFLFKWNLWINHICELMSWICRSILFQFQQITNSQNVNCVCSRLIYFLVVITFFVVVCWIILNLNAPPFVLVKCISTFQKYDVAASDANDMYYLKEGNSSFLLYSFDPFCVRALHHPLNVCKQKEHINYICVYSEMLLVRSVPHWISDRY